MKKLIIANWKMNPGSLREARKMFLALKAGLKDNKNMEVAVCPPFVYLAEAVKVFKNQSIVKLGGQNCFWEEKGAFTGEVSAKMLKSIGVKYVIVGHSERRRYFDATDDIVNKKIKAALAAGLVPILCVGETAAERKNGQTAAVLQKQFNGALKGVDELVVVAYEPLWAIGTGRACSADEAVKAANILRRTRKAPILYGGSVNSQNADSYIAARLDSRLDSVDPRQTARQAGLDGLLIGGASLNPKEFLAIIESI